MKSLNKVYDHKELFYYCNCCGDINIPGTDPLSYHEVDELPIKERNLYENYWREDLGCHMYVVNYKGSPAMALSFLFDTGYLADILKMEEVSDKEMDAFYTAMADYAQMLESNDNVHGCEILVGENTDPDGHELVVIVPYEKRTEIDCIAIYLDQVVYSTVESLM